MRRPGSVSAYPGCVGEPLVESIAARPRPSLRPLVSSYVGYRIEGAPAGVHRGLPSRHLTFIVTLDGTVDLESMPDPHQPPGSFTALGGGLHSTPALIRHNGNQHGIQAALTPLGARTLFGLPAAERGERGLDAVLVAVVPDQHRGGVCLLYTSPSPRDRTRSRMPSSA